MVVAGIDIGAGTTKAVIMRGNQILASDIIPTSYNIKKTSEQSIKKVLEKANLVFEDLERVVSTGYGRHSICFTNKAISEITCHAKGVHFVIPQVELIIDIGCQDSKAIRINREGDVTDFVMNDKCAAGTGRFLEVMAGVLGLKLDELGPESLKSTNPSDISSTCTIFAESEVVALRAQGLSREDLVAGIHKSIAKRVSYMALSLGLEGKKVAFTGGVSKNPGVIEALEEQIGQKISVPKEPQLTGALGAALAAQSKSL